MDSERIGHARELPRASSWRPSAVAAAALAFASALCSAFWLCGGTTGLDTVGGEIERMARERSAGTILALSFTLLLKLAAGVRGARRAPRLRRPRWELRLNLIGGILLALYGAALVLGGALALTGVVGEVTDSYSLHWHVFFWDAWFLLWGALWTAAALQARRADSA